MKRFIAFSILSLCCSIGIVAQTSLLEPQDVRVRFTPTADVIVDSIVADTLVDAFDLIDDNLLMNVEVSALATDTLQVNKIYLKVGRSANVWDVFDSFFEFDQSPSQSGVTYLRKKEELILGIGEHSNVDNLYYEIFFEDHNGDSTIVVSGNTL